MSSFSGTAAAGELALGDTGALAAAQKLTDDGYCVCVSHSHVHTRPFENVFARSAFYVLDQSEPSD